MDKKKAPSVKISVDCSSIDQATEKANRLADILREASSIIDSLSGAKIQNPDQIRRRRHRTRQQAVQAPDTGEIKENGRKHCPACAREIEPFWNFCVKCGTQLKPQIQVE